MKELIDVMKQEMIGIQSKIGYEKEELQLAKEQNLQLRQVINQKDQEILQCKQDAFQIVSQKKELELKIMKLNVNA